MVLYGDWHCYFWSEAKVHHHGNLNYSMLTFIKLRNLLNDQFASKRKGLLWTTNHLSLHHYSAGRHNFNIPYYIVISYLYLGFFSSNVANANCEHSIYKILSMNLGTASDSMGRVRSLHDQVYITPPPFTLRDNSP